MQQKHQALEPRQDVVPVILGGDIGVYALVREFHEAFGVPSHVINSGFIGAIEHSAICVTHAIPTLDVDHAQDEVASIARQHPKDHVVLIGNTDAVIELIEGMADGLPGNVIPCVPPKDACDAVCDKVSFSRLCTAHGLDVPQMSVVHFDGTGSYEGLEDMPFPVVAKPAVSAEYYDYIVRGFQKVYYLTGRADLEATLASLGEAGFAGDFLVQELIGGDDTYMDSLTLYVGADGEPRLFGAAQVLLEDHSPAMLGNPVAMIVREKPQLWKRMAALLADAGYHGFANFDIKRDPATGRELFLDCNPRIGRNSYYNVAGGVNPMQVMVHELVDGRRDDVLVASRHVLYSLVPNSLLRRYVRDADLLAEVDDLIARGLVFDPQRYGADWGMRRRMDVELTERNQVRKFNRYYPQATDSSF